MVLEEDSVVMAVEAVGNSCPRRTPNGAVNSLVAHRAQRRVPHNALDAQLQVTADVRLHRYIFCWRDLFNF